MKASMTTRTLAALALASVLGMAGLSACSAGGAGPDANAVAATVNGTEITEGTVTDYIQNFREAQQVAEDDAWGLWLNQYGMKPSDVREDVIGYFVDQELVKMAAEEKGVTVDEAEVDEQVNMMKQNYGTDEDWQKALEEAGTTEEEYRENVRTSILQSALQEKIIEENHAELTDEELLEQAVQYAPFFDGAKKSSHILFNADDADNAQKVLDQINNGEIDFAEAAKQYSQDTGSAENGGDVGWDMLNSFVTAYTDALDGLDEGQTSGLVTSDYGIHIIRCTEKFTAPQEITSLDQLPTELVDYIRQMADSSAESEAYNDWYTKYKEDADIQINEMPEGLPYDIPAELYTSSESSSEAATEDLGLDGDLTSSEMQEIEEAQAEAAAMDEADAAATEGAEGEATSSEASTSSEQNAA